MAPDLAFPFPRSPVLHVFQQDGGWHWGITVPRASGCGFKLIAFSEQIYPIEGRARIDGDQALISVSDALACDLTC